MSARWSRSVDTSFDFTAQFYISCSFLFVALLRGYHFSVQISPMSTAELIDILNVTRKKAPKFFRLVVLINVSYARLDFPRCERQMRSALSSPCSKHFRRRLHHRRHRRRRRRLVLSIRTARMASIQKAISPIRNRSMHCWRSVKRLFLLMSCNRRQHVDLFEDDIDVVAAHDLGARSVQVVHSLRASTNQTVSFNGENFFCFCFLTRVWVNRRWTASE
jgi:hypothetical protein